MTVSITKESKNNVALTKENRYLSPTWDEATMTWDEATETWDTQGTVWVGEAKNNAILGLESKIYTVGTSSLINDANLQLYLEFNDNVLDSGPVGHTINLVGTAGYEASKLYLDKCKKFINGESGAPADYIYIPNHAGFSPGVGDFTVGALIKFTNKQNFGGILYKRGTLSTNSYRLAIDSSGKALVYFQGNNQTATANGITDLSDGEWHTVIGVKDGKTARIYVDGVEEGNGTNASMGSVDTNGASFNLWCGALSAGSGTTPLNNPNSFIGEMDELFILNRKFTPTEILNLSNG